MKFFFLHQKDHTHVPCVITITGKCLVVKSLIMSQDSVIMRDMLILNKRKMIVKMRIVDTYHY